MKAITRAITGWRKAGIETGSAWPWETRRQDKSDFNDLMREAGPEAVRARIELVTDHDAFAYFADRYDLEVVGTVIPSFDSSAEVSAGDLDDLAATIRRTGTRAIFTEQSLPPTAPAACRAP